mgnify:CR=1 FL=1
MDSIQIKDKQFTVSIKEQDIQKEVIRVANEINRDLAAAGNSSRSAQKTNKMPASELLLIQAAN